MDEEASDELRRVLIVGQDVCELLVGATDGLGRSTSCSVPA
jgi:hypothetical protein